MQIGIACMRTAFVFACVCVYACVPQANCSTVFLAKKSPPLLLLLGHFRRRGHERAQVLPNASIIRFCGQSTQFNATGHAAYALSVCECV